MRRLVLLFTTLTLLTAPAFAQTPPVLIRGEASGTITTVKVAADGAIQIDCESGCSGGTQFAEDTAHTTADNGTVALAVRRDTTPSSSSGTAGDYSTINVDANGRLYTQAVLYNSAGSELTSLTVTDGAGALNVICDSGCSGGTQYAVDAALGATPTVTLAGAIRDDTLATLTPVEDDAIGLRVNSIGALWIGGNYKEDEAHASADVGIPPLAVRRDTTPSVSAGTAGDYATINVDGNGRLYTQAVIYNSSGTELTVATDQTEDAAEASGVTGPVPLSVRRNAAASSSGATGDYSTLNTDALGLLWSRSLDPCNGVAKSYHVVNMNTATTVEIANAVASEFWYICSVNLVAAAAQTVSIAVDDTDGCGSLEAGLHGGATAATGWSFAANGGIALGNGNAAVLKAATANRYLCIITGQAQQVSGTIVYVSAP